MKIVLNLPTLSVFSIVEIISINPGKFRVRLGYSYLSFTYHRPMRIFLVLQIKITESTNHKSKIVYFPIQVLR